MAELQTQIVLKTCSIHLCLNSLGKSNYKMLLLKYLDPMRNEGYTALKRYPFDVNMLATAKQYFVLQYTACTFEKIVKHRVNYS